MDNWTQEVQNPMQVTRATDYAVRIMVELASLPPGDKVQLNELIESTGVRGSFLSKVVQQLVHAGMVSSHRGTRGGFSMRVSGEEVTLLDVVEAIEGADANEPLPGGAGQAVNANPGAVSTPSGRRRSRHSFKSLPCPCPFDLVSKVNLAEEEALNRP